MKLNIKILLILLLATLSLQAQDDDLPNPVKSERWNNEYTLVSDFAKIFSDEQFDDLENILRGYHDSTSTQVYVVTVEDLKGYDVSDFAARLGEKWGIGQKDKNNGVLILIKPRIGYERGQVFIATGYGVEHKLTDARCGRIIDQYMIPHLAEGDYYNASKAAIGAIIGYMSGEFQADEEDNSDLPPLIVEIIVIVIIVFILYAVSQGGGGSSGGRRNTGGFGGGGGGFGGGFGGGSSGGGWSSGGGGFGGGGGGSFGGGGAGRSF